MSIAFVMDRDPSFIMITALFAANNYVLVSAWDTVESRKRFMTIL